MYRDEGLARRIIDLPADAMTRQWLDVTSDRGDEVMQRMETLSAQTRTNEGLKCARKYGGSLVLMGVDDGQFKTNDPDPDLTQPVIPDKIKSVNFLKVYSARREVEVLQDTIDTDPTSETFGEPTIYRINQMLGGGSFDVHASRVLRFDGAFVPSVTLAQNAGWHDSVFQSAYTQIRQVGTTYASAEFIIGDFVQTIVKIKDLINRIAAGQEDFVKARIALLDLSRHVANTVLLDSDEDYSRQSSTVAGLAELLDRFMMALSSVTGIPVTLLMGRSPAGMNATGESDIRFWYDKVQADQVNTLGPQLEKLIRYLFLEDGGAEPEEWSINFRPLFQMTEKEKQELYKGTAEGDAIYIAQGVLEPEEVAISRFAGEEFDTGVVTIDVKGREEQLKEEDEPPTPPTPPPVAPGEPGVTPTPVAVVEPEDETRK
jgi:phage-related protein (TIGR01555 family)